MCQEYSWVEPWFKSPNIPLSLINNIGTVGLFILRKWLDFFHKHRIFYPVACFASLENIMESLCF